MRAAPATIGGMPRSSKRASERQSATSSRSPCTTWIAIAVWPSWKVVKSCARAVGIVLLRGMMRSTSPPMVSMPSDSGITSSSSRSPARLRCRRARRPGCAAPSATTSSGSRSVSGARPKNSPTARWTSGMRVEPPTRTTPSTSPLVDLGVAQRPGARRRSCGRRSGLAIASRSARVDRLLDGSRRRAVQAKRSRDRRSTALPWRARGDHRGARWSPARLGADAGLRQRPVGERGDRSRRRRAPSRRRWRSTSNTPRVMRRSEMSKVPPPRS